MEQWQKPETIALWIAIVSLFLIILLSFIAMLSRAIMKRTLMSKNAELAYQKELLETTIKTQEKERERISADLHDELIGKLTAMKMRFSYGKDLSKSDSKQMEMLTESIDTARRISHDLSPPLVEFSSLEETIQHTLEQWEQSLNIEYGVRKLNEMTLSDDPDVRTDFKIQMIRIVQELVTNSVRHGNATELKIWLRLSPQCVVLSYRDNGKGFDHEAQAQGLGLRNIESRVSFLQGRHKIKSKQGKGMSAVFHFALEESERTS